MGKCSYCGKSPCSCGARDYRKKKERPPISFKPSVSPSSAPVVIAFWGFVIFLIGAVPAIGIPAAAFGVALVITNVVMKRTTFADQALFAGLAAVAVFGTIGFMWGLNGAMEVIFHDAMEARRVALEQAATAAEFAESVSGR